GSGVFRCGRGGDEAPSVEYRTILGSPRYQRVMALADRRESLYVGDEAQKRRGLLSLRGVFDDDGNVTDWQDMISLWQAGLHSMKADLKGMPLCISVSPRMPTRDRHTLERVCFEQLQVSALLMRAPSLLSLYATGTSSGCVVSLGETTTSVSCYVDGYRVADTVFGDVSGRDMDRELVRHLGLLGHRLDTAAGREAVREIKERYCRVGLKAERLDMTTDTGVPQGGAGASSLPPDGEYGCVLPDGTPVDLSTHGLDVGIPETLFQPGVIGGERPGLSELVCAAIGSVESALRPQLWASVVLAGGTSLLSGLPHRLGADLWDARPSGAELVIHAPRKRDLSAWLGGSMLSELAKDDEWTSRQAWLERGPV
ncbi:actin family protein, partial [Kipferlia bialata]